MDPEPEPGPHGSVLLDLSDMGILEVRGDRAFPFLQQLLTRNIIDLKPDTACHGLVLDRHGSIIDDVYVVRRSRDEWERDRYWILTNPCNTERVKCWFRGISDGYVLFDEVDVFKKVEGPVVIEDLSEVDASHPKTALALCGPMAFDSLRSAAPEVPEILPGHIWQGRALGTKILVVRSPEDFELYPILIVLPTHKAKTVWGRLLAAGNGLRPHASGLRNSIREQKGLPRYGESNEERNSVAFFQRSGREFFDLHKPYFVGQRSLESLRPEVRRPEFQYQETEEPLKRTALNDEHLKLTGRMAPFAGWEMPVWYTSIAEEHRSVRETAGLFDTSHMGVFEISGEMATPFLDMVITNYVRWIQDGECQYAFLLDPKGCVIDDVMLYRHNEHRFMLVVNAANKEKDLAWLKAVQSGKFRIDPNRPEIEAPGQVTIRDLKDSSSERDQRVDLALQGPNSLEILKRLTRSSKDRRKLGRLRKMTFMEMETMGLSLLIARTGYTGERIGFEIFVHPADAPRLWSVLLKRGNPFGIKPAGLGARDSTRTEAGLPLHGHELAGPLDVSPKEAGFAPYVKYHKPYFIGRDALLERDRKSSMEIIRFRVLAKGVRVIKSGAPVISRRSQQFVGRVTSCVLDAEGVQVGLALIDRRSSREGTRIGIFPKAEALPAERPGKEITVGQRVPLHEEAVVISRFPEERLHVEQFRRVLEK